VHTTWRSTAAHVFLAAGVLLAVLLAVGSGTAAGWRVLPWLTVALLGTGLTLSWLQHRASERFRRNLGIGLTHHMRTSLAHIRAYNEMLLLGRETSEDERRNWLEVVGREAERLGSAVENLLLIVNDRQRNSYPIRRAVDLGEMLEDVACEYTSPRNPELRLAKGPPSGIMVDADPAALKHALGNLFLGLSRCCEPGGDLSAELTSNGATAMVVVDLSRARPAGSVGSVSTALRPTHLEGTTEDGFGLDLAVVEHVARAHGGRATPFRDAGRAGYRLELPLARSG
jgi:two-component system phosphate regulon sensor histidine kinase PhoR